MSETTDTQTRRRADISSMAALFMMILQMAGGIWYVSKLDATVQQLVTVVSELKSDGQQGGITVQDHGERIRLLEYEREQDDVRTQELVAELRRKGVL